MKLGSFALATALLLSCDYAQATYTRSNECKDPSPYERNERWSWFGNWKSNYENFEQWFSAQIERFKRSERTIAIWDTWRSIENQRASSAWGADGSATSYGPGVLVDRYYETNHRRGWGFFSRRRGDSYIRQGLNEAFFIDFTVTATGQRTELHSFDFKALFNNPDAQKNWTLSVESGDITLGTVIRGELTEENAWEKVKVDLRQLADNDLGPGGTATFRLSWWGGAVSEDAEFGTGVDKVNVTASVPVVPEGIRPGLGERADWMRGSWGINWKPSKRANGLVETLVVDDFLTQIEGLRTLDYIQLHLGESHVESPVHWGPHALIESLWLGDLDADGNPINLAVPRESAGVEPFLEMLKAVKAKGLRTQVYINSANMLGHGPSSSIPNIPERWKEWCDTDPVAQAFIKSQPYHEKEGFPERAYMFCYAEFVLREYAIRYGDLVDAWLFDTGRMMPDNGDDALSGEVVDQKIYEAFALACRAGNPDVPVSFNNSPGERDLINNPFSPATRFDDYMFGHPFAGGKRIGDHSPTALPQSRYEMNYSAIQWITAKNGNVHNDDGPWTWDDKVVGHFDPPLSTSAWNSGGVPALTDDEFLQWNREALMGGGAMSWGAPLNSRDGAGVADVLVRDWAMHQFILLDAHLQLVQFPDTLNWSRAGTVFPEAFVGQAYYHTLVEGVDFWDPQGNPITNLSIVDLENFPSWLSLEKSTTDEGVWILSGIPTECKSTDYSFDLLIENGAAAMRTATLQVSETPLDFTAGAPGSPVWANDHLVLADAEVPGYVETFLIQGVDFYDFEGDELVLSIASGASWLNVDQFSTGIWSISGIPSSANYGVNEIQVSVSDGANTAEMTIEVFVLPALKELSVFAAPNTDYGVDTAAIMMSETLTAYDGLATFKIAFDVMPQIETSIASKASGGVSVSTSWGVNADAIFNGNLGDVIDGIGNLRVIDFEANGGILTSDDVLDMSFSSVEIVNGQSPGKDSVGVEISGVSHGLGTMGGTPYSVDLKSLAGDDHVSEFSLYTNSEGSKNKWSVYSVTVSYR